MAKKKKHHRKKSVYKQQARKAQQSPNVEPSAEPMDIIDSSATNRGEKTTQKSGIILRPTEAQRPVREVRHSLILAALIFVGLAVLWAVFSFSGVGPFIYKFIKI